ncbi:transcription factor bHLH128 [Phalaenopsis equestris]|uniref:transcription factor bHLH128 n=1 Tax=Phalaenopsis equestris TaxID=78828 RepID=UPI0009E3D350|nr:transcription factor bHLH128 [Phalaenopsis equestris]
MSQSHSTNGGVSNRTPPPMNAAVHRAAGQPGLTRYGSAPGSLLARVTESVISGAGDGGFRTTIGSESQMSRFFPRESPCLASDSGCQAPAAGGVALGEVEIQRSGGGGNQASMGHRQPFDLGGDASARDFVSAAAAVAAAAGEARAGDSHLMRQHSSPAGFFSHLMVDTGFAATSGTRSYFQPGNENTNVLTGRRLKSQLSFSRQDAVSQISEISILEMGESSDEAGGNVDQSYVPSSYPISSWDETNSIVFSTSNKHSRDNGDIISTLNNIDSPYGLPGTSVDMSVVDKLLQIQQDSVPFKVRAKRGCATHPRSIAERERRTRISEKLRKLQEIVPNMDKQTSTADMLDLAVQHIKGLQSQIQILKQDQASCTCISNVENS